MKYTSSGRVLVGARRRGGTLRIEVLDTGQGIPESRQKDVFREFQRLPQGEKAARGLGLGLSIVERIAKALDVEVALRSEPGRGSVFSIELPVTRLAIIIRPAPERKQPRVPPMDLRILALDNEPAVLDGMRTLLAGWGCAVATAATLDEALGLCGGGPAPDVVVADFHLDDGDGLAAIAALRGHLGAGLPAVLVTADRSPALADAARSTGIAVLNKPVKPAALRALLAQMSASRTAAE